MASPQAENGYTKIANEIMEALAGIRISGEARQCLDVIIRKTYGYNKKEDIIALSQFQLLTKMPKATICRALLKLAKMNLIIIKNDNGNSKTYRFYKDFEKWKPLTKKIIIDKKDNGRYQKCQSSLTKKGNTKETITKDNITKETIAGTSPAEPFSFKDKLKEMKENTKNPLIPIIAYYWEYKQLIPPENQKQYQDKLARELRGAKPLVNYQLERIKEVMEWLNGSNFLTDIWTIETIFKFIDKDLTKINQE